MGGTSAPPASYCRGELKGGLHRLQPVHSCPQLSCVKIRGIACFLLLCRWFFFISPPPRERCEVSSIMSVCPSVRSHPRVPSTRAIVCIILYLCCRSFLLHGGVAIRFLLPVLWLLSHSGLYSAFCVFLSGETVETAASIPTKFCSTIKTRKRGQCPPSNTNV